MASMLHARSYNPVLHQKIRVSTELYGVRCKIYAPEEMGLGFMAMSELKYFDVPMKEERLLIPRAVLTRAKNPHTDIIFSEEEMYLWSVASIPRYSKVIVVESEILSFIVSEVESTEDSRGTEMYYKYTLVPSSMVTSSDSAMIDASTVEEDSIIADPDFRASIEDSSRTPTQPPSASIKVGKL